MPFILLLLVLQCTWFIIPEDNNIAKLNVVFAGQIGWVCLDITLESCNYPIIV